MRIRLLCAAFCCALLTGRVIAGELRPFTQDSMSEIAAARDGRPFVLAFWSLSCTYCREDLDLLAKASRSHPALDIVLVATDTPDEADAVATALSAYRFARAETWVFADAFAERLRFAVDRSWHGELPRTYLYDAKHRVVSASGSLAADALEAWIKRNP